MITRSRVIGLLILVGVLGAVGASYKFYFQKKLEAYSRDQKFHDMLDSTLKELNNTFHGTRPEVVTEAWSAQVVPWNDALTQRTSYFSFGTWLDHEKYPQGNAPMIRFWYEDKIGKDFTKFYQDALKKVPDLRGFPAMEQLIANFSVTMPGQWLGINVTEEMVSAELEKLSFGFAASNLLLDAKPTAVYDIRPWPESVSDEHKKLLKFRRLGLRFQIKTKELVAFLEKLRTEKRYFTVDAMRITYPYISNPNEPELFVEMLLSQAAYAKPSGNFLASPASMGPGQTDAKNAFAQSFGSRRSMGGRRGGGRGGPAGAGEEAAPGPAGKAWRWFKTKVLYMK